MNDASTGRRTSGRRFAIFAAATVITVILAVVVAEVGVRSLIYFGAIRLPPLPTKAEAAYYDGQHEKFGVWRRPSASLEQISDCSYAEYHTNSVGARDRERALRSDERRVIMLGDSFVAGWGVPADKRISDILEAETGIEHLNFAMAHFSPYQSYLAYRYLAKSYDHDLVLIGVLPGNDFNDLDREAAEHAGWYTYRYRPYLVGEYPDYVHEDLREPLVRRLLRMNLRSFTLIDGMLNPPVPGEGYLSPAENHLGLKYSYFHEYTDRQFRLLQRSLELLFDAVEGRPVVVFLIPNAVDFIRYRQSGSGPLTARLESEPSLAGIRFIDLLPAMYERADGRFQKYFFTCDYHWNEIGNRVAADILREKLAPIFYDTARRNSRAQNTAGPVMPARVPGRPARQ